MTTSTSCSWTAASTPKFADLTLLSAILTMSSRRAAWRWDIGDEFPDGHQHGQDILSLLRQGPPWPALGTLAGE